ncbi:jg11872 [Pararge aegeria aegeria]|uniref:Jg11872 protein n=1 Tax=Pararge aegeria aegeria TaxID=348720 RepID=A0A8S4SN45_9NEOP|nr:jg11872 [Pararge aegeria aegeria]
MTSLENKPTASTCDICDTSDASFTAANIIVRYGKPFDDGEFLKEAWLACAETIFADFEHKDKLIQCIENIPLSKHTIKDKIHKLAENVIEQQKNDIKSSPFVSLFLDNRRMDQTPRLAIIARYCAVNEIKEELMSFTCSKDMDMLALTKKALTEKKIDTSKIVSITTEDYPDMKKIINGVTAPSKNNVSHSILEFDCIISPTRLFLGASYSHITSVLKVVYDLVKHLLPKNFCNYRQLEYNTKILAFLDEVYTLSTDRESNSKISWLRRGEVLQRFVDCLEEIKLLLQKQNNEKYLQQLMDITWLAKLMFLTDLCQIFKDFNAKLQDADKTVIIMSDLTCAFEAKLQLLRNDIVSKKYKFFPNLQTLPNDLDSQEILNEANASENFSSIINDCSIGLSSVFSQFRELSDTLKFIMYPDMIPFGKLNLSKFAWLDIDEFEMTLIDFQCSTIWTQKFIKLRQELELIESERLSGGTNKNANNKILEVWSTIPNTFSCVKKLAFAILTIFPSTSVCESVFYDMRCLESDWNKNCMSDDEKFAYILLKNHHHQHQHFQPVAGPLQGTGLL